MSNIEKHPMFSGLEKQRMLFVSCEIAAEKASVGVAAYGSCHGRMDIAESYCADPYAVYSPEGEDSSRPSCLRTLTDSKRGLADNFCIKFRRKCHNVNRVVL